MGGARLGDFSELLLGLCVGALLSMAAAMLRAPRPAARWTGFAFFFTSALFALKLWCDSTQALPMEARAVIGVLALTSVGWFWLMVMVLFDDVDEFRPVMFAAPGALFVLGIAHQIDGPAIIPAVWTLSALLQSALAVHALIMILRSWKGDLVEPRRAVRGPFMVAVALYILSLNGFDLWELLGDVPSWYPMLNAGMLATCVLGGAFVFLEAREAMFGEHTPEPALAPKASHATDRPVLAPANGHLHPDPPPIANGHDGHSHPILNEDGLDRAARADLDKLEALMCKNEIWREEGLTIASLALRASIPENQLRRLINDRLGYRNFPAYVNAHRIACAKQRLADPKEARVSISAIAYDIGFASLGPFNRAFREETGSSPTEWRRMALGGSSPIPA